jgi:AcrR family transcriptional regulator
MGKESDRPYHHGRLREAVIAAAVAEVEAVGAERVSMREIARRAGVSHAAPAHHFGDREGIFTAIATEGFQLASEVIGPAATGRYGFLDGGAAYVAFALTHPGHFQVMFRPELYRADDPPLVAAREESFEILYRSARALVAATTPEADSSGVALAGWSLSHGFATLWLTSNLHDRVEPGADTNALLMDGLIALGKAAEHVRATTD